MTPKERAAMQRALEALEMHAHGAGSVIHSKLAWDALREALAEQAEQEPYAPYGFCPICGRRGISRERRIDGNDKCVTGHRYASSEAIPPELIEPVKQEPVAWKHDCAALCANHVELWIDNCPHCGKPRPAPVQQAEQSQLADASLEPVGYFAYDEERDIWEELTGPNAPGATPLYAAPVQQVDLTDDEINQIINKNYRVLQLCRAVIAAYKEKNK